MAGPPPPAGPRGVADTRLGWVDRARGIGILLVVFGHVWRGVEAAGLLRDGPAFRVVDAWIYAFHMPLFFLLSGLFARRFAETPARVFLAAEAGLLIYPYVLWSLIQGGLNAVLSAQTNSRVDLGRLVLDLPTRPYAQFWFLYALAWIQAIVYALARLGAGRRTALVLGVLAGPAASWARLDLPGRARQVLNSLPYYVLGYAAAAPLAALAPAARAWALWPLPLAASGLIYAAEAGGWAARPGMRAALALAGIAGTLAAALATRRGAVAELLGALGRLSLPIYLAHVIALAGARIALVKLLHVRSLPAHLALGTLAGVGLPVLLALAQQRFRIPFLFQFRPSRPPAPRKAAPAPPPETRPCP